MEEETASGNLHRDSLNLQSNTCRLSHPSVRFWSSNTDDVVGKQDLFSRCRWKTRAAFCNCNFIIQSVGGSRSVHFSLPRPSDLDGRQVHRVGLIKKGRPFLLVGRETRTARTRRQDIARRWATARTARALREESARVGHHRHQTVRMNISRSLMALLFVVSQNRHRHQRRLPIA